MQSFWIWFVEFLNTGGFSGHQLFTSRNQFIAKTIQLEKILISIFFKNIAKTIQLEKILISIFFQNCYLLCKSSVLFTSLFQVFNIFFLSIF